MSEAKTERFLDYFKNNITSSITTLENGCIYTDQYGERFAMFSIPEALEKLKNEIMVDPEKYIIGIFPKNEAAPPPPIANEISEE